MTTKAKKYLGVYFDDNQWEIVPSKWITKIGNSNKCYWPPDKGSNIQGLAKENTTPRKNWTEFIIKQTAVSSDDYDRAYKKMTQGNLASTSSEAEPSPRRVTQSQLQYCGVRRSPRIQKSNLPRTTVNSKRKLSFSPNEVATPDGSSSDCSNDDPDPAPAVPLQLHKTSTFTPQLKNRSAEESTVKNGEWTRIEQKVSSLDTRVTQIEMVVKENNLLLTEISNMLRKPSCADILCPPPANDSTELLQLASNPEMVKLLQHAREGTLTRTVTKMLKLCMTRSLALQFSLTGLGRSRKRDKLAFRNTMAYQLIEQAILSRQQFREVSLSDINKAITLALKNAVDWDGHRGPRVKDYVTGAAATLTASGANATAGLAATDAAQRRAPVQLSTTAQLTTLATAEAGPSTQLGLMNGILSESMNILACE